MILTCPECSTRYSSKADTIGPNGRTVRCAKCGTSWFVGAEAVDPDALALKDNVTVVLEAEPTPVDMGRAATAVEILPVTTTGAHVSLRDRAEAEKRARRRKAILAIWAVPLVLLGIAAVLAFSFRQEIVNRMPEAASLYQGLGLNVKTAGLDIAAPTTEIAQIEGEDVLIVTTEVMNRRARAQVMPMLALSLHNRNGDAVAEWFVESATVEGRGARKVTTQYPNPPVDAVRLSYRFAAQE